MMTSGEALSAGVMCIMRECGLRGELRRWRAGKYHPNEDATFPKDVIDFIHLDNEKQDAIVEKYERIGKIEVEQKPI